MIHRTRSRLVKLSIAVFGAVALLVTVPAPASAGRGDHDRYVQHDRRHARHHGAHHGGYCRACRHRASHERRHAYHNRDLRYTCRPCGRGFHTSRRLHDHLLHHHHVSPLWFPFTAVHLAWSWDFPG